MDKAIARVTSDDVNVLLTLVLADESHVIDRLKDLATPFVVNGRGLGNARARPVLQLLERRDGISLAEPVTAAPNNHVAVYVVALDETNVLLLAGGVVYEGIFDGAFRKADGDAIGAEIFLFSWRTHIGSVSPLLCMKCWGLDIFAVATGASLAMVANVAR